MSAETNGDTANPSSDADLAEAFKELAKGERTASALEAHLTALERKIDELLKQADADQKRLGSQNSIATSQRAHPSTGEDEEANSS